MTTTRTALILGATGGIGGAVAKRLAAQGWTTTAMHRDPAKAKARNVTAIDWIRGDAMSARDVLTAARGADVIVHAVNPPGYRDWEKLVLPMLDNTIAAAKTHGARIVLPGTVYNYGPDALPLLTEASPQSPKTRKGRIRAEMEARLRAASTVGARVLIVRTGDFFGPHAGNNWFSQGLVRPGKTLTAITYPGKRGVGHQWAYLPDVAETIVRLLEQDLGAFALFHMEGVWDADGRQMVEAIKRIAGQPDLKVKPFPWWLLSLAAPFVPLFREMAEMRYLWRMPVRMTNEHLVATLGQEPRTPLEAALRATMTDLRCL